MDHNGFDLWAINWFTVRLISLHRTMFAFCKLQMFSQSEQFVKLSNTDAMSMKINRRHNIQCQRPTQNLIVFDNRPIVYAWKCKISRVLFLSEFRRLSLKTFDLKVMKIKHKNGLLYGNKMSRSTVFIRCCYFEMSNVDVPTNSISGMIDSIRSPVGHSDSDNNNHTLTVVTFILQDGCNHKWKLESFRNSTQCKQNAQNEWTN